MKLSQRTAELGYPMHRVAAIAKIEAGERAVTVPELFVLAAALNTVPLALLLPTDSGVEVEVLPGVTMAAHDALGWFTGTANATPSIVAAAAEASQRVAMAARYNEIVKQLETQRHNLFQLESGLEQMDMPTELESSMRDSVYVTRILVQSLEEQQRLLHARLFHGKDVGGTDGG